MANNYRTNLLRKGSTGREVSEWQKFLLDEGYYKGSIDGDFGSLTDSATRAYQKANNLTVDGIVGEQTRNSQTRKNSNTTQRGSNNTPMSNENTAATPPTYDSTTWDSTTKGQEALGAYNTAKENVNSSQPFTYEDYVESDAVKGASDALNNHLANKPGEYQSQWQSQLDALMNSIMNRDKFSYDVNGDALYQQYKDKYIQQGKMSMADTMGQAAAMTGGYGNSYAQSVGQQAYQASLDNLNDIVPELYAMALDQYNREGQELYSQYGMLADRENLDYNRYRDIVSDYLTERDYLQGRYDTERGFDYGKYVDDRSFDYALHQDEYQRLMDALGIAQSDYYNGADMFQSEQANKNDIASKEFADEMTIKQWERDNEWHDEEEDWKQKIYDRENEWHDEEEDWKQKEWDYGVSQDTANRTESNAKDYHTSGGKYGYDNGALTEAQVKEMQEALGINADGKWGSGSTEAAGGLTADQAWKAYKDGKLGKADVTYADIEGDLNYFISQGASKSEINSYLREALNSGYITPEEYKKLKEIYAPAGQIYGTTLEKPISSTKSQVQMAY